MLDIPTAAQNVVPILDRGQDGANYIIAMPLASESLEDVLASSSKLLPLATVLEVLNDISSALDSLHGTIVHRDIKPGNILRLNGKWCLTDFGISRYAAAATGTQTHKGYGSAPYLSPEQWRFETATSASDMYSFGVVAYQLLTGGVPFQGTESEVADGHLNVSPPKTGAPQAIDWLVMECLKKTPAIRPTAAQFNSRLEKSSSLVGSPAAVRLAQANEEQMRLRDLAESQAQQWRAEEVLRAARVEFARELLTRISDGLLDGLRSLASMAAYVERPYGGWSLQLGQAELIFDQMNQNPNSHLLAREDDPFTVLATASIYLRQYRSNRSDQTFPPGRAHALWYADVLEKGTFAWYETAFIQIGGLQPTERAVPFDAAFETTEANAAIRGEPGFVVAWPFTKVDPDDTNDFLNNWFRWFGDAIEGRLGVEIDVERAKDSWRPQTRNLPGV